MADKFRSSPHIDFDDGRVLNTPETLIDEFVAPHTPEEKLELFECRVDVWQLGVAVEILKQIEDNDQPSTWSHAAYGLVTLLTGYFEMVGKILNPDAKPWKHADKDFNVGFCDVYPEYRPAAPIGKSVPLVDGFRSRLRNGLFHLAFPKYGLILHNSPKVEKDFTVLPVEAVGAPDGKVMAYCVNPHGMTRTLVKHFPTVIDRIRSSPPEGLWKSFLHFYDTLHTDEPEKLPTESPHELPETT